MSKVKHIPSTTLNKRLRFTLCASESPDMNSFTGKLNRGRPKLQADKKRNISGLYFHKEQIFDLVKACAASRGETQTEPFWSTEGLEALPKKTRGGDLNENTV